MNRNSDLIKGQQSILREKLSALIKPGEDYVLLDFPDHANVGDSAIWLGEIALLKEISGHAPRYVCSCEDYDEAELLAAHPTGPILIHGGGNLGDLWMRHQKFREDIIRRFKGREIIQLPQTIYFKDEASSESFARLLREHGNVHIFARDQRSADYALARFDATVELSPDAAFGMGLLRPPVVPDLAAFMLLRIDSEKVGADHGEILSLPGTGAADWLDEPKMFSMSCRAKAFMHAVSNGHKGKQARRAIRYHLLASGRVDRGLRLLASGRVVITDRLHAHILSVLMGLPNVVLDNNYGKIHQYMSAWTKDAHETYRVGSVADAARAYKRINELASF